MSNPTANFNWQMPTSTDLVTDLPADFEVFGQAVDTSLADLKGGTTGQILSKATNTDMDFVWVTSAGDIEGVTATSPLTGGGTTGTVTIGIQDATTAQKGAVQLENSTSSTSTTTAAVPAAVKSAYDLAVGAIPKTLTTTTGDTIYASSANTPARLGIGSTGQVLTVSGGVPSWATPAAGAWTLLTSGNLPSANSVVLSSISQSYKNLRLILKKMQNTTDAENFNLRFNGSSSAVYNWGWDTGTMTMTQTFTRLLTNIDNTTQNGITVIDIPDYANTTTMKFCLVYGWNTNTLTTSVNRDMYMGGWNQTSAISSLTVYGEGGSNFDAGTYELYGEN